MLAVKRLRDARDSHKEKHIESISKKYCPSTRTFAVGQSVLEAKATQLLREKSGLQDQVEGALYEHS